MTRVIRTKKEDSSKGDENNKKEDTKEGKIPKTGYQERNNIFNKYIHEKKHNRPKERIENNSMKAGKLSESILKRSVLLTTSIILRSKTGGIDFSAVDASAGKQIVTGGSLPCI